MNLSTSVALGLSLLAVSTPVLAEVKVPAIFSDNMVLQRNVPMPIWGTARPGEEVKVTAGPRNATTTADASGAWRVTLDPLDAGNAIAVVIAGSNTITLKNVVVGEVWICSGQSNMEWSVAAVNNAQAEIDSANDPDLRTFTVARAVANKPTPDCTGSWQETSPANVKSFSAVGYFFAKQLRQDLKVPIGMISTSVGGTPVESWISGKSLGAIPEGQSIQKMWESSLAESKGKQADFEKALAAWEKEYETAKLEAEQLRADAESGKVTDAKPDVDTDLDDKPATKPVVTRDLPALLASKPKAPEQLENNPWAPSGLYNGMISPVVPYGIRGAVWYQGESNAGRAYEYRTLMPMLISDWRRAWGQGDFPFIMVQLANFTEAKTQPEESEWAELREAQSMATQSLPNVGIATAIDIGDAADIHPRNKQEVGRRLGLQALTIAYVRKDVIASGPVYQKFVTEADSIRIDFVPSDSALVAKDGGQLVGFQIAGEDRKWVWADATVEGKSVVVKSASIKKPVAVRYAWANNPPVSLYNEAGLPALPFRTDDWPGMTVGKRR